jgi:hypothetical protein
VEAFQGESVFLASRSEIDGVRVDVREVEERDRPDEAAEGEARPVLGFGNFAPFRKRPVAVASAFDEEDERDRDVALLRGDAADLVGRRPQLLLLGGEAPLDPLDQDSNSSAPPPWMSPSTRARTRAGPRSTAVTSPEGPFLDQGLLGFRARDDLVQLLAQRIAHGSSPLDAEVSTWPQSAFHDLGPSWRPRCKER